MENTENKRIKRIVLFMIGFVLLLLGITLILKWWVYLSVILKGMLGIILALAGMFVLAVAKE